MCSDEVSQNLMDDVFLTVYHGADYHCWSSAQLSNFNKLEATQSCQFNALNVRNNIIFILMQGTDTTDITAHLCLYMRIKEGWSLDPH